MATDLRRRHGVRGAILVETAIVVSALLTLMVASIELGIVGFLQLTVDAGSFLNAHQNVVGVQDALGANDATSQVFPQIKPSDYGPPSIAPAPSPSVYVDYGYNGSVAEQTASPNNRHGGASMIQPYQFQNDISKKPFSIVGIPITVESKANEPYYLETAPEWDVANQNYGQDLPNSQYRTNAFSGGENTPMYFMAQAYQLNCALSPPWSQCNDGHGNQPYEFHAVALGNNLNAINWNNTGAGINGSNFTPNSSTPPVTGTFEMAAQHQRLYAQLAQFFAANSNFITLESTYYPSSQNSGMTEFTNWAAFNKMWNGTGWVAANATAQSAYGAIREIYSWDVNHGTAGSPQNGPPNLKNYPLQPWL